MLGTVASHATIIKQNELSLGESMTPDQDRMGTRAASKHRCLCGRYIGTDGCGKCLHYVCARCKKVADHTNGTTDHSELCDACWSAEFADTQEAMAS